MGKNRERLNVYDYPQFIEFIRKSYLSIRKEDRSSKNCAMAEDFARRMLKYYVKHGVKPEKYQENATSETITKILRQYMDGRMSSSKGPRDEVIICDHAERLRAIAEQMFHCTVSPYEAGILRVKNLICQCGAKTEFVDSKVIYGRSYGYAYLCPNFGAYVGTHRGTATPLGIPAKKETQQKRRKAHKALDSIWKNNPDIGRKQVYRALAKALEIPEEEAHIGMMNSDSCEKTIKLVENGSIQSYLNIV